MAQKRSLRVSFLLKVYTKEPKAFMLKSDGIDHGKIYEYSVQAYDMFDVAYQHINGSVDLHDMKGLFHVLRAYFAELMPLKLNLGN